jgi:hypothetical protein
MHRDLKNIIVMVDVTYDELYTLIDEFRCVENENIEYMEDLILSFECAIDRLEMYIRALRDKLNESKIL